jgi:type I restriction enzyme S subunit
MRDGWIETSLGEIAEVIGGGTPSTAIAEYWDGNIVWLTPTEITSQDGKVVSDSIRKITDSGFKNSGAQMLKKDSVILTSRASVGYVALAGKDLCTNQGFQSLVPKQSVLAKFLMFWIQQNRSEFESRSAGSTFKEISKSNVKSIKLQLPPLPEQKRIIDLISSVDSYIESLQQQLESAKNSKSAYVNTIVTAVFARGKKTKIADIAEVKGGKRLPKGTPWSEEPTDHRYIRVTDIKDGVILTENLVYVPDDVWPLISRYVVNQGDVVITIAGTIGQVGVIPDSLDGVNLTENAAKIVVDRKLVRSNYLGMLLGSNYYQQDIDSKTKKTTQPKLGLNMINSIEIPLPELAEQDEIFSVVSQIDTLIASTNDLIMQTITLRSGLLSDLLSGEHEIPPSYDKVIGAA